jgi:S1-C subfamily serine protease
MHHLIRTSAVGRHLGLLAALLLPGLVHAATLTSDMQKAVRAATFEVVLRKPDKDRLSYEKPLPLDLIPYAIRSDAYWSIGTAFAIGPNTYVSAAHVLLLAVGSQFGAPALRDTAGHVYPVDQVEKLSLHEDFVVFTLAGSAPAVPLPTSAEHQIDDTVFAVGNALGEGVIVRDGLLTSETPEEQDGRWKWLRFSAAASPGNSGGPLLGASGRVIGIVLAKSPNENLNYALPIARALDAPKQASFDVRYSVKLPNARQEQVATLKSQLALPKPFGEFAREYRELRSRSAQHDHEQLESSLSAQLFPKGNSGKLLASVYYSRLPMLVQQDRNDSWDALAADNAATQELPGRGLVETGDTLGVTVFRLRRPQAASDAAFYHDAGAFMDMLLKGLKLQRLVGTQQIRITSLGHSIEARAFEDHSGRRWQVSIWPLGYIDSYVVCYALPTPEGYVGMVQLTASPLLDALDQYLRQLADALYVSYSGTLAQWQAFLARSELRPRALEHNIQLELDEHQGLHYRSTRLALSLPRELADFSSQSELVLEMTYIKEGERLTWDVGGLYLYMDQDEHIYVGLGRHVKPADETARELLETWDRMRARGAGYNGVAGHDAEFKSYWVHDVVSAPLAKAPGIDPNASVLYDVFYGTTADAYPRDLEETQRRLIRGTRILER